MSQKRGNMCNVPCRCCVQGTAKASSSTNQNIYGAYDCECCGIEISEGWDYYELPDGTVLCDECMLQWMSSQYRRRCGEER